MKLVLVTCTDGCRPNLEALFERFEIDGYTEIPHVLGRGETGKHFGSRAHPGTASLFLAVLPNERVGMLTRALEAASGQCAVGEGMHVYTLNVEEVVP